MIDRKRSFVTLDGLRGIAALAVLTLHVPYFRHPFFESYLAVDFFFVLSGFVLAHAYGQRLREDLSTLDFVKIRIVRLYPLYGLAIVISGLLILLTPLWEHHNFIKRDAIDIPAAILFLPSPSRWAAESLFPLNGPSWSLFFELIANSGWALMWRRAGDRALIVFITAAAFILIGCVLTGSLGFGFARNTGIMDNGYQWGSIGAGFVRVGYSFFCGVFIYQIWSKKKSTFKTPAWFIASALFFLLAVHPPINFQTAYDLIVTIIVFPLLVWLGANSPVKGRTARIFSSLGTASFGIYILQVPLNSVVLLVLSHFPQFAPGLLFGVCFVCFVILTTLFLDRYFDRPVRSWLIDRIRRRNIPSLGAKLAGPG